VLTSSWTGVPNKVAGECISHCASDFWIFYYKILTYCTFKLNTTTTN